MKGRIYDPTLGRFMQADPFVQSPHDSQSYNRFAYVRNNPMSYTDPSGFIFKKLVKLAGFSAGMSTGIHEIGYLQEEIEKWDTHKLDN